MLWETGGATRGSGEVRPGGVANGLLAVGSIEDDRLGCQTIEIGRADVRLSVAIQFVSQIIGGEKEDIRTLRNQFNATPQCGTSQGESE